MQGLHDDVDDRHNGPSSHDVLVRFRVADTRDHHVFDITIVNHDV
jgi:hypothetical protein